jgi:phosphopantothenoylcysteine decarboxylase/phosphopantothenate--cysteine ligase
MNVEMWRHPATQANISILRARGDEFIDPDEGYQACGEVGVGRLAEVETIVARTIEAVQRRLTTSKDLQDERVLITAGPTVEDLDPVRFITNRSSGRMGYAIAEAARDRGAQVTLVSGPTRLTPPGDVETISFRSNAQMYEAVMSRLSDVSIFVVCAAVDDFRPVARAPQKIKKRGAERLTIELEPTEDIIGAVGADPQRNGRIIAGFAAESEALLAHAEKKMRAKKMDLIVANDITRTDAGFDVETNAATIIRRDGSRAELSLQSKREIADRLLDEIAALRHKSCSWMGVRSYAN